LARIDTEMALAQQVHVANVRIEIPWFLVEPARNSYDWSRADYIFNSASSHGILINPILVYTPTWDGGYTAFPPAADFQAFVTAFMGRYGSRISAIEMWNEPDGGQSLVANNPSQYVSSILKPGFTAVKSTYPAVKVIEGGSINDSGTCCAWLSGVINAGGGAYFDIAAFHDYGGNYGQVVSQYRAIVGSKPIWMGEYGVSDSTGSQQSSLITAALTQTPGLAMAQFYTLRDESVYTCCPPAPTGENKLYGVVASNDVTRKSSFYTMQSLLGGSSPPPPPPPPPPSPASPSPTSESHPTPSSSAAATPSSSSGHQGRQSPSTTSGSSSPNKATPGASPSGSGDGASPLGRPSAVSALVSKISSGGDAGLRLLTVGFLFVGLATFGWGASLAMNVAAFSGLKPRPPIFKARPVPGIGVAAFGAALCALAVLLLH